MKKWMILAAAALIPTPTYAQIEGVIIQPFLKDSVVYGEPGQVVKFIEKAPCGERFVLHCGIDLDLLFPSGTVRVSIGDGDIVPLDSVFTPAYILARLRCADRCGSRADAQNYKERVLLASSAIRLFPNHPDVPEFRALQCDYLEPPDGKGDARPAIACAEQFIRDYPSHRRADEMRWWITVLGSHVYEFLGDVDLMKQQADAYERFLAGYPQNSRRENVLSEIAQLYYMMQESSSPGPEKDRYRARALEIYDQLARSELESMRLHAVIYRFNLLAGRRIHIDPTAWLLY